MQCFVAQSRNLLLKTWPTPPHLRYHPFADKSKHGVFMKKRTCIGSALLVLLTATLLFAADVTGAWNGETKGPNGDGFQLTFNFKQDGPKLTGTISSPGGDIDISNGKVDGDKISFTVSFNGMTIQHDGVINGDQIKLTTKASDPNFPGGEMTLTRAK
jgi:hypothetical protein